MRPRLDDERKLFLLLIAVFSAVAILTYFPILKGKIPFPAEMVTGFPPWESVPARMVITPGQAEYGDVATLFYPWRYFQGTALRNGELPLWNPHILSGSPFLGDTESALFYPINAVFYVLPLPIAWTLKLVLNVILAGTLTALFVRAIGGSLPGAISAGIVFALAGNMTTWQSSMITDAALWLPLICLAVHRLCFVRPGAAAFVLTAMAFAAPVLAGHPEMAAHLTVAGIGYAFWQSFASGRGMAAAFGRLSVFAAAGLLAIGIASIQIMPTLEWLGQINHTLDFNWGTLKAREVLSFFSRDIATNPNSSGLLVPESAAYAGGLTLLLAPLALLHRNRRQAIFFLILIVAALQIVFGGPAHWLMDQTPVMSGLKNWRFLIVIDFSLAVLAGLGISALSEYQLSQRQARRYIWVATTLSLAVVFAGIWVLRNSRHSDVHWLQSPKSSAVFLGIGYCLVMGRTLDWLRPKAFAIAALGLISVDLITYAHGYFPFVSPHQIYPDAPLITFLKNHNPSKTRIVNLDATYGPNVEMMYGLSAVGGWDLGLRLIKRFLEGISEPTLDDLHMTALKVVAFNDRRLDLLNAKYFVTNTYNESYDTLAKRPDRFSLVYTGGSVQAFENRFALPRAFFVPVSEHAIEILPDEDAQLTRVKDPTFDPERAVILTQMPPALADLSERAPDGDEGAGIEWTHTSPNHIELRVTTKKPGVLVLSQIFYPGWQVLVDQVETPILRTDYALTGVALKEGSQIVKFVYRPASFRTGSALTVASISILIVVLARAGRKGRTTR